MLIVFDTNDHQLHLEASQVHLPSGMLPQIPWIVPNDSYNPTKVSGI